MSLLILSWKPAILPCHLNVLNTFSRTFLALLDNEFSFFLRYDVLCFAKVGGPQLSSANMTLCGFAICGPNFFVICRLKTFLHNKKSSKKTTLRTVMRQNCEFGTGKPNKFADMRLRNKPSNFKICDLQTQKKVDLPTTGVLSTFTKKISRFFQNWRVYQHRRILSVW